MPASVCNLVVERTPCYVGGPGFDPYHCQKTIQTVTQVGRTRVMWLVAGSPGKGNLRPLVSAGTKHCRKDREHVENGSGVQ